MSNAELFKKVFGIYAEEFWAYPKEKMLDWLTSNVPETNVGDMISRQAAIDANDNENPGVAWLDYAVDVIKALPSAQPERKRGRWIRESLVIDYPYKCSACKKYSRARYDFCPGCGADMREGKE